MMKRIWKYRVECSTCDKEVVYETEKKRSLPEGWEEDPLLCGNNHRCPDCIKDDK